STTPPTPSPMWRADSRGSRGAPDRVRFPALRKGARWRVPTWLALIPCLHAIAGAAEPVAPLSSEGPTRGWPAAAEWLDVLLLRNYNTALVVLGTTLLGIAAGLVGSYLLLRKRSLMGDALSHATLPGIAIAFAVMVSLGGEGKSLPGLLLGATLSGVAGIGTMLVIRNTTRLREDVAMGFVLSVFFGVGVASLRLVQNLPGASAAGLESFI